MQNPIPLGPPPIPVMEKRNACMIGTVTCRKRRATFYDILTLGARCMVRYRTSKNRYNFFFSSFPSVFSYCFVQIFCHVAQPVPLRQIFVPYTASQSFSLVSSTGPSPSSNFSLRSQADKLYKGNQQTISHIECWLFVVRLPLFHLYFCRCHVNLWCVKSQDYGY